MPSAGVGYWFYDLDDMKLMAEAGLGWERTEYRGGTTTSSELVLIPRGYFEKQLLPNLKFSQDLTLYPAVDDFGDYRLHSETVFTSPLTKKLSLNFSFIDDYDSSPPAGTEENDLRIISSLKYSF